MPHWGGSAPAALTSWVVPVTAACPGRLASGPPGAVVSLQGPWVWGLGPACHLSTWLDRLVTSQTAAATLRGLPVPSVTLRAGSARVGQAALVAAVTAASLVGGASHTASPVPAMDTPSRATHSQASARTAVEPPRAGTVRGEAALKGLGRGQDEGLGPAPCATAPRCLDGYYGDPTLGCTLGPACGRSDGAGHPRSRGPVGCCSRAGWDREHLTR